METGFKCEECQREFDDRQLTLRNSQPGNYCRKCGVLEKCAACGEMVSNELIVFKTDIQKCICKSCEEDYKDVIKYIMKQLPVVSCQLPGEEM